MRCLSTLTGMPSERFPEMLVLSRKGGESILIGNDIKITFVRTGRGSVRVGIDAPRDMEIVREELVNKPDAQHAPKKLNVVASA